MPAHYQIILASQSPRRKQLLAQMGIPFSVQVKQVEETLPPCVPVSEAAAYLAEKKARAFEGQLQDYQLLLTADTVVIHQDTILAKPQDEAQAKAMLERLSGQVHTVVTAVSLATVQGIATQSDATKVYFRALTQQEIDYYVTHYQPMDKAGAYGIQEWIGMIGITKIEGSFFTVMGLPTHLVYQMLQEYLLQHT
ncbi:MAG: Maf family protein [Bernardetiaceae bacterium]|nr:Maf family protein [Bernardetiaceae bacterium]